MNPWCNAFHPTENDFRILEVLQASKEPMTASEIQAAVKAYSLASVVCRLKRMTARKIVEIAECRFASKQAKHSYIAGAYLLTPGRNVRVDLAKKVPPDTNICL